MEVPLEVKLLDVTKDPGLLIESIAEISYQTQRFFEKKHPKLIKFGSGRVVPYEEFGLESEPLVGKPLPGYSKDDNYVSDVIPASWENVVKFILAIVTQTIKDMPPLPKVSSHCYNLKNVIRVNSPRPFWINPSFS